MRRVASFFTSDDPDDREIRLILFWLAIGTASVVGGFVLLAWIGKTFGGNAV